MTIGASDGLSPLGAQTGCDSRDPKQHSADSGAAIQDSAQKREQCADWAPKLWAAVAAGEVEALGEPGQSVVDALLEHRLQALGGDRAMDVYSALHGTLSRLERRAWLLGEVETVGELRELDCHGLPLRHLVEARELVDRARQASPDRGWQFADAQIKRAELAEARAADAEAAAVAAGEALGRIAAIVVGARLGAGDLVTIDPDQARALSSAFERAEAASYFAQRKCVDALNTEPDGGDQ